MSIKSVSTENRLWNENKDFFKGFKGFFTLLEYYVNRFAMVTLRGSSFTGDEFAEAFWQHKNAVPVASTSRNFGAPKAAHFKSAAIAETRLQKLNNN